MSSLAPGQNSATGRFGVDDILSLTTSRWDKRIAIDLIAEMESHLADRTTTLPLRWSRFMRQAAKVDLMTRMIHHEDPQTVYG
jgi:hypothetical protein